MDATIELMRSLKRAAPKLRLTLGCSTFVPKAHTPFQWYGVSPGEHLDGGRVGGKATVRRNHCAALPACLRRLCPPVMCAALS